MKKFLGFLFTLVILLGSLYLQIFFNFFFSSNFMKIFPTLIVIFGLGCRFSSFTALWAGFFIGLCIDSFNFSFSGYDTFLYALFGALSGLLAKNNKKIQFEGLQRIPVFILFFNVFLFGKSLLVAKESVDMLSWIISAFSYYFVNMLPANILTIILFIAYFGFFRHER